MSHRSKRPFGKIDFAALSGAGGPTPSANGGVGAAPRNPVDGVDTEAPILPVADSSAAALIAAVMSRGSTESLPELVRRPTVSPPLAAPNVGVDIGGRLSNTTSEDSLNADPSEERKPRRPRPRPINLAQVNLLKSTGMTAQMGGSVDQQQSMSVVAATVSSGHSDKSTAGISSDGASQQSSTTKPALSANSYSSNSGAGSDTYPVVDSVASFLSSSRQQAQPLGRSTADRSATATNSASSRPSNSHSTSSSTSSAVSFQIDIVEDDLENLEELGMGSGGTVYRVRHRPTATIMAKKIIHQLDSTTSKEILRELQILNKCNSPHIISFYGAYEQQGDLCICMEYMDVGSLERIGKVAGRLPEKIIGKLTVAVLAGLVYLYESFRIVHRDIKPSNILINSDGKVKLCDFGVSGILENSVANTFVGTGAYMSPERIQGAKYATQCDTWSLGLTLLEMALGRYPFSPEPEGGSDGDEPPMDPVQLSIFELLQHIISDPTPRLPRPSDPPSKGGGQFTDACCDFIELTLTKDPQKRPTPRQLLNHEFVVGAARIQIDMAKWARGFLEPNLDAVQSRRWSVTQKQKRDSRLSIIEKRKSGLRGSVIGNSGSSGAAGTVDSLAFRVGGMRLQQPKQMSNSVDNAGRSLDDIPASPPMMRRNM